MNLLPTTLAPLAAMADDKEGTRWAITGIEFESLPDRQWSATATDTKRLLRVSGPDVADADTYPQLPGLTTAPNGAKRALIPASKWESFFRSSAKLTKKSHVPVLKSVALKIGDEVATFGATDGDDKPSMQTKLIEGLFPPYRDIMPKIRTGTVAIRFDAKLMAETLSTMAAMMPGDEPYVRMEIHDHSKPIRLSAKTLGEMTIDGIVMPIGFEKNDPDIAFNRRKRGLTKNEATADVERLEGEVQRLEAELSRREAEIARLRNGTTTPKPSRAERLAAERASIDASSESGVCA